MPVRMHLVFLLLVQFLAGAISFGQVYEKVASFSAGYAGTYPLGLTLGNDGAYYGVTQAGGGSDSGTVFRLTTAGEIKTVVEFNGATTGKRPAGPLVLGVDGNFYGTTSQGGVSGHGTVFRITPSGVLTSIATFSGPNGSRPLCGLALGLDGNFYGTTETGGSTYTANTPGWGTVYRVTPGGKVTTLYSFTQTPTSGQLPRAGLTLISDGSFVGTTYQGGGTGNVGTVFKITHGGTLSLLASFPFGGGNPSRPSGEFAEGPDGSLYGTTESGGTNGFGAIVKISPGGVLSTVVNFDGYNGWAPLGRLTKGPDGSIYGTTKQGGANFIPNTNPSGFGSVFRISPAGVFSSVASLPTGFGRYPVSGVCLGSDGSLFGTASEGGAIGRGTIFKVSSTGVVSLVRDLDLAPGRYPLADVVEHPNGDFYGTTAYGGTANNGTVYRLKRDGTLTTLLSFSGTNGFNPKGGLVVGNDGNLYGTTESGGIGFGTIFKVTPEGVLTTVYQFPFDFENRGSPSSGLILGSDGFFYGTTSGEGPGAPSGTSLGTVFKMSSAGLVETLVRFTGANGAAPKARLMEASDGNFYGTTSRGSESFSSGTIFRMTPAGALTTLVNLDSQTLGRNPLGHLLEGADGSLYGTTSDGDGHGTVFKVNKQTGAATRLGAFPLPDEGSTGGYPHAGLVTGPDGNYYGTAYLGGREFKGTVFRLTPGGVLSTVYDFADDNVDIRPETPLALGSDGNLYGTSDSAVYRLLFPGSPSVQPVSASDIANDRAQVGGRVNARGSTTTITIEVGTDGVNFPTSVAPFPVSVVGYAPTVAYADLSGLAEGTTYYYRVIGTNTHGSTVSDAASFTTLALPAAVATVASNLLPSAATLNGTVNGRGLPTAVRIEYGTDGLNFPGSVTTQPAVVSGSSDTPVNATITGLLSGGTYFYRVVAANTVGTVTSAPLSLTTLAPPLVGLGGAQITSANSATVLGSVNPRTLSATAAFEFGTDGVSFPNSSAAQPSSVVGGETGVNATLTGLLPGTLYYYRLKATSAGGTSTTSAATFTTPLLPTLVASIPSVIGVNGAALFGTANGNGAGTIVSFEYGTDGLDFPSSVSASPAAVSGSNATGVSASLGGLSEGTTYYFRIRGASAAGSAVSNVASFTTLVAPAVGTGVASSVSGTSATVTGFANARGTSTSVVVEYGIDGATFPFSVTATPSPVAGTTDTAVSAGIGGLAEKVTYYFRIRGTSVAGTAIGEVRMLTTLAAPIAIAGAANDVSVAGATLKGTIDANGSATTVSVEVATDAAFTAASTFAASPATVSGDSPTEVIAVLGSLPPSATFFYRLRAVSAGGTVVSNAATFTTPIPPVVTLSNPMELTARSVKLTGSVNASGASSAVAFDYALDSGFTNPSTILPIPSPIGGFATESVYAAVNGLSPGTSYFYRLRASSAGGTTTSSTATFTTPPLPAVSESDVTDITSSSAHLSAMVSANGSATTITFEYGPSAVSFPFTVAGAPAIVTGNAVTLVAAVAPGLSSNSSYFFRVRATSLAGEVLTAARNFMTNPAARAVTGAGSASLELATLSGTFNGFGQSTEVSFDYGTSPGQLTKNIAAGNGSISGNSDAVLAARIVDLTPGTRYYFRARATNASGTIQAQNTEFFDVPGNEVPIAVPDVFYYSGQIEVDPLENDEDPNNQPPTPKNNGLTIEALIEEPLVSQAAVAVIDKERLSYTPQFNIRDDDDLIYRVTDRQGATADAQVRLIAFAKRSGMYGGRILSDSGTTAREGRITVQMGGTGTISTSFVYWPELTDKLGESFVLKGTFNQRGRLSRTFNSPTGAVLTLTLALDPDLPQMLGQFEERIDGNSTTGVVEFILAKNGGTGGLAESGVRTGYLGVPTGETASMTDGFLRMVIGKDKRRGARFAGRLPDGEPFLLSANAEGRSYSVAKRIEQGGVFTGLVRAIDATAGSGGIMGDLFWKKSASARAKYHRDGVDAVIALGGGSYPVVAQGELPPIGLGTGTPNARLRLSGGGLDATYRDFFVNVLPNRVEIVGPDTRQSGLDLVRDKFQLKLDPQNAGFRGRFVHPLTGKPVAFDGVFLMPITTVEQGYQPGRGRGVFRGPDAAGSVEILPLP